MGSCSAANWMELENCYTSPLLSSNPELLLLHQCAPEKHVKNHGINSMDAASSLGNDPDSNPNTNDDNTVMINDESPSPTILCTDNVPNVAQSHFFRQPGSNSKHRRTSAPTFCR